MQRDTLLRWMGRTAINTGVTGQDGAYLAEFLLNKDYKVQGIKCYISLNINNIDLLYQRPTRSKSTFYAPPS